MTLQEMPISEQLDCAIVLFKYIDFIKEGYFRSLSPSSKAVTLIKLGGILNGDGTLCEDFRKVLDNVIDGREIEQITIDDVKKIASRYQEWHPQRLSRLGSLWHSEAYSVRALNAC